MSTSEWSLPLCFQCGQSVRRARTAKPAMAVASRKKKKKVEKEKAERGRTPDAVHRVAFSEVSAFTWISHEEHLNFLDTRAAKKKRSFVSSPGGCLLDSCFLITCAAAMQNKRHRNEKCNGMSEHVHRIVSFEEASRLNYFRDGRGGGESGWGGRGILRKWLKNKWKNDFPFWLLSQWREKAMGRLHGYLSGWGQSVPVVAAHYKTLPIYPPLSHPSTAGWGLLGQIT